MQLSNARKISHQNSRKLRLLPTSNIHQLEINVKCRRRHETVGNLAREFEVSPRTIRRDISAISLTEPIYTQSGRYHGGVYVLGDYAVDKFYLRNAEVDVLQKVFYSLQENKKCQLTPEERNILSRMVSEYRKPFLKAG